MFTHKLSKITEVITRNAASVIIGTLLLAFVLITSIAGWLFIQNRANRQRGSGYVYETIRCNKLGAKEREEAIRENFQKWPYKKQRFLWGVQELEIARNNKQSKREIEILERLLNLKNVPRAVRELLIVELAHKQMENKLAMPKLMKLVKQIRPSSPVYGLASEVIANNLLEEGDVKQYNEKAKTILNSNVSKAVKNRVQEVLEVTSQARKVEEE